MYYKHSAQGVAEVTSCYFAVLTMFLDCICEELELQKDGKDIITDLDKLPERAPL